MPNSPSKRKARSKRRLPIDKLLDKTGWAILAALQQDARLSFHQLGRLVGLSAPATAERVRRLEEAGVIAGYRAVVPPEMIGLAITAFVRLTGVSPERYYARASTLFASIPGVREAHHVAGDDSFIVKVAARDVERLERIIGKLTTFGRSVTSIVLSTPLTRPVFDRPPEEL